MTALDSAHLQSAAATCFLFQPTVDVIAEQTRLKELEPAVLEE
jgi:hypothetical protein